MSQKKIKELADKVVKEQQDRRSLVSICYKGGMEPEDVTNLIAVLDAGTDHDFEITINNQVKGVDHVNTK